MASFVTIPFDNIRTRLNTQCDIIKRQGATDCKPRVKVPFTNKPINAKAELNFSSSYNVKAGTIECICHTDKTMDKVVKYKNAIETTNLIWKKEGIRGFFKGLGPKT